MLFMKRDDLGHPYTRQQVSLKGLSHDIFRPVWMHLGLNVNRLWFFNLKEGSSILYSYFKC
jgi:hypothetical protein